MKTDCVEGQPAAPGGRRAQGRGVRGRPRRPGPGARERRPRPWEVTDMAGLGFLPKPPGRRAGTKQPRRPLSARQPAPPAPGAPAATLPAAQALLPARRMRRLGSGDPPVQGAATSSGRRHGRPCRSPHAPSATELMTGTPEADQSLNVEVTGLHRGTERWGGWRLPARPRAPAVRAAGAWTGTPRRNPPASLARGSLRPRSVSVPMVRSAR